jgi:outer membrane protein TolC
MKKFSMFKNATAFFRFASFLSLGLGVSSCAVAPDPLSMSAKETFAQDKFERVDVGQERLQGALSLHEAMARALKYNLDTRVEIATTALRLKELDLSSYKMLPNLVVNGGYAGRDNDQASNSFSISRRQQSLETSTSQERNVFSSDIVFSWNILDFGLSYVRAQQAADEALIASEMRRKVSNRIMEDVRTAYWRAVTDDRLVARLRALESRVKTAISNTRRQYNDSQTSPVTALTYERELLEVRREIQRIEGELVVSKAQLAALINVRPNEKIRLQDGRSSSVVLLRKSPTDMIRTALVNRPEMHEIAYRTRINEKEATAALLELLPGLQPYVGGNIDSNKYLLNKDWVSFGAKASWNVMKVFQYPGRSDAIEAQEGLLDQRALALTMAIMTQVHVSNMRYFQAQRELGTAADYLNVQSSLLAQMRAQAATDKISEQTLIREEMNTLVAEVKYDLAHAALQNAYANLFASMGLDPIDATVDLGADIKTLTAQLARVWKKRGDGAGAAHVSLVKRPRVRAFRPVNMSALPTPASTSGLTELVPPGSDQAVASYPRAKQAPSLAAKDQPVSTGTVIGQPAMPVQAPSPVQSVAPAQVVAPSATPSTSAPK